MSQVRARSPSPPPLATGDRLTRPEFERRAALLPEHVKVELLDGEVYMAAATKAEHGDPHALVVAWLTTYAYATPGTKASDNSSVRLDEITEPQPDVHLRVLPEAGGLSRIDEDGYVSGAVELMAEVAASSVSIDLNKKKEIYLRNGIREYVVLAVHDAVVFWFALEEGVYVPLPADRSGVIRSRVFPGLWLDTRAAVRDDGARVLKVLDRGIASKAHQAYVRELAAKLRASRRRHS